MAEFLEVSKTLPRSLSRVTDRVVALVIHSDSSDFPTTKKEVDMSKDLTTDESVLLQRGHMERRGFLRSSMIAGISFFLTLTVPLSACGGRVRARRRVRRRTRRRVRHNAVWRTVAGRRALVVPVNIEPGDELVFDDGRVGKVTVVQADSVVLNIGGTEQTVPAVFEGEN